MYRAQAATYAQLSGEAVTVSERRRGANNSVEWRVENESRGVETDYTFLAWDDIIRRSWIVNPATLLGRSARTYWNYVRLLDWPRVSRLPQGPLVTLFYPALSTVLIPLLLLALVWGTVSLWVPGGIAFLLGLAVALAAGFAILHRMKSFWLLRFFIFNDELTRGTEDPELMQRLGLFADRIAAELATDDHDEVLLITHSNGSILSVPLMAMLMDRFGPIFPERFTLLTLGQCIPLLAQRRDARPFHADLAKVATASFDWVDIGYMPDGAAFSKVDPFGPVHHGGNVRLEQLSPRFFAFWNKAAYNKRRKNKYELHFDYLRCGDRPSPIDHVSMTAGRRPLRDALDAFKAIG